MSTEEVSIVNDLPQRAVEVLESPRRLIDLVGVLNRVDNNHPRRLAIGKRVALDISEMLAKQRRGEPIREYDFRNTCFSAAHVHGLPDESFKDLVALLHHIRSESDINFTPFP